MTANNIVDLFPQRVVNCELGDIPLEMFDVALFTAAEQPSSRVISDHAETCALTGIDEATLKHVRLDSIYAVGLKALASCMADSVHRELLMHPYSLAQMELYELAHRAHEALVELHRAVTCEFVLD